MQIRCPSCRAVGNVPESALNKKVRCPRCAAIFQVSEKLAAKGADRRKAERVEVDKVGLDFGVVIGNAQVLDMSAVGVGFEPSDADYDFSKGQRIVFSIVDGQEEVLKNIAARVTRTSSDSVGSEFESLTDIQTSEIKHFLARKRFEAVHEEAQQNVELEMDEDSIRLKSKGFL